MSTPYVIGSYGPVEITAGRRRWFRRRYLAVCALCRNGYITHNSADAWDIARDHMCAGRAARTAWGTLKHPDVNP